jgi:hypothetical protein
MTPIIVYREDIENAIERLNGSTVDGIIRAINILQNALLLSSKPTPCIKNTSDAFSKETVELELNNKYAIVELLDMLMEHAKYHIEALGIDSKVFTMPLMFDAENLKNRLTGEK